MKKLEDLNTLLIQFNYKSIINTKRLTGYDLISNKVEVAKELNIILKHLKRINITAFTEENSTVHEIQELRNTSISLSVYNSHLDIINSIIHETKKVSKTLQSIQNHISDQNSFNEFSEKISFQLHENNEFILFIKNEYKSINTKKRISNDVNAYEKSDISKELDNSYKNIIDRCLNLLFNPKRKINE